jgi:hypothetical protein
MGMILMIVNGTGIKARIKGRVKEAGEKIKRVEGVQRERRGI